MSLRGIFKCGAAISVANSVQFAKENTYIRYDSTSQAMEFYVDGARGMGIIKKVQGGGGYLHGVWYADNLISTSDRRLKTNVRPLLETLGIRAAKAGATENAAEWMLRELRPVSYRFKVGAESKMSRFGFIADEVEETMPQVIRESPKQIKGIAYQDLIAVLTAALQSVQGRLEDTTSHMHDLHARLDTLESSLDRLQEIVAKQAESTQAWLAGLESSLRRRAPPSQAWSPRRPDLEP